MGGSSAGGGGGRFGFQSGRGRGVRRIQRSAGSPFKDQASVDARMKTTSMGGTSGPNAILRNNTGAWQSRNEVVSGDSSMMGQGGPESRVQRKAAQKANAVEIRLRERGFWVNGTPDPIAMTPRQERRDAWAARNQPATSMAQTRRQERQRREMEG